MKQQTNRFTSKSQTRITKKSLPDIYTFIDLEQPEDNNNVKASPTKPLKNIKIKSSNRLPKSMVREIYSLPD
jgi:hypothetical protein